MRPSRVKISAFSFTNYLKSVISKNVQLHHPIHSIAYTFFDHLVYPSGKHYLDTKLSDRYHDELLEETIIKMAKAFRKMRPSRVKLSAFSFTNYLKSAAWLSKLCTLTMKGKRRLVVGPTTRPLWRLLKFDIVQNKCV
ncbi:hypothetical protein CEXT_188441 [Caerostris extrusa]|uniref:Uncharacterized protein n=1 Tax=Caerostris extrusa TaxID=172846 RepID=A0AAV4NB39_CAEEX|nr:hypothetical protein CEXT_188441 [Caerostris extrusa]